LRESIEGGVPVCPDGDGGDERFAQRCIPFPALVEGAGERRTNAFDNDGTAYGLHAESIGQELTATTNLHASHDVRNTPRPRELRCATPVVSAAEKVRVRACPDK
jgi:hypothetical protein